LSGIPNQECVIASQEDPEYTLVHFSSWWSIIHEGLIRSRKNNRHSTL